MGMFKSRKKFDGFSTCFRQWRANTTHCQYLHGYDVEFEVTFEGELDHRNWVWDFGGMKRSKTKIDDKTPTQYFNYLLDHTVIVAQDDPFLPMFKEMDSYDIIQLRILPATGCEKFAEHLYYVINNFLDEETDGRVRATRVEVYEHEKNSASYGE